jgi:hypothetical protein
VSDNVFPHYVNENNPVKSYEPKGGLSKREMIAAMCLQGMLTAGEYWDGFMHADDVTTEMFAKFAVQQTDALIAELAKEPK